MYFCDKCCYCIPLRIGCLIFGYLELMVGIAGVYATSTTIVINCYNNFEQHEMLMTQIGQLFIISLVTTIFTIALLHGLHYKKPSHIMIYIIYSSVMLGIYMYIFGMFLMKFIGLFHVGGLLGGILLIILILAIKIFFSLALKVYYNEIMEEQTQSNTNLQHEERIQHGQPMQHLQQVQQTQPMQHVQNPQPMQHLQHIQQTQPMQHVQNFQPMQHLQHVQQTQPMQHVQNPQSMQNMKYVHDPQPMQHLQHVQQTQPMQHVQNPQSMQNMKYVQDPQPMQHLQQVQQTQPTQHLQHSYPMLEMLPKLTEHIYPELNMQPMYEMEPVHI